MKRKYIKNLALILLAVNTCGYPCLAANGQVSSSLSQQQNLEKVVSGVVLDENSQPVISAIVSVPGTKMSVLTNMEGRFILSMPERENKICVSYIGYRSETVKLSAEQNIKVLLKEDAHLQDEMIPLALMQKEKRNSVTGAFSMVKGDVLEKHPSGGLAGALTGKLSGLTVLRGSDEAGNDGADFYIRGYCTNSGDQPLIVLDGVPSPTLDINILDPRTIESVVVLKDAAACALYGFEASAGAILVTTKRGFNGKPRVSVSADFSLQQATVRPEMLHSWDYAKLRNQAQLNDGLSPTFTAEDINKFESGENRTLFPDNNWYKMFMRDVTTMQRYNLNITGGNERVKYFVNAGFLDQGDLIKVVEKDKCDPTKYMQRFNERTNVDIQLLPNLNAFLNQMVVIKKSNSPAYSTGSILNSIYNMPATEVGPLTPDGGVVVTPFETNSIYGKINRSGYQRYVETTANVSLGLNWGLDFITKGLQMKGTVGYESRHQSGIFGGMDYARYVRKIDKDKPEELLFEPYGTSTNTNLSLSKGSNYRYFLNFNGSVNYDRTFNDVHEVSGFVNYFAQDLIREGGDVQILPYDQIAFNAHAKYGYDSKYYIQADATWMGSDQFKRSNGLGFFPTISGAWVASNESFIKENVGSWLSNLRLKASFGKVGNDQLAGNRYMYRDNLALTTGGFISSLYNGAYISEVMLGNPNLKWEDSYQQNYGISLGLFNSLTLNFDYYIQRTRDIIVKDKRIPALQGLPTNKQAYVNEGKINNRGYEFELEYNKQLTKDFHITASGQFSFNKNKIVDVLEPSRASGNYYTPYLLNGHPIDQNFGYLIDYSNGNGYFNSQQEIKDSKLSYVGIAPRPGDFIYKDMNNDGLINEQDQVPIGYTSLPQMSYGANLQLNYQNVDFFVQVQGVSKVSTSIYGYGAVEYYGQGSYTTMHMDAWTPEKFANGEKIAYPALATKESSSMAYNSFFICDRSYMRIKNIEIGYSLPKAFCKKMCMEKVRFYLNGANLLTFDNMKFKDLDPESSSLSAYPHYRTYNVGLNIIF